MLFPETFIKMHGLGNDFAIFDMREQENLDISKDILQKIANRKIGIGCDQIIFITDSTDKNADIGMDIYNADGGKVEACGNATRCVASLIMDELSKQTVTIKTGTVLTCQKADHDMIAVDMGKIKIDWADIPLKEAQETLNVPINIGPLKNGCAVNVGNPHIVFFLDDVENIDLEKYGPLVEQHDLFPEKTNVEIIQILSPEKIRTRVWERGVGITDACGTGACATLVAAYRHKLSTKKATIILDGGPLDIELLDNNHILMTGPVEKSFIGKLDPTLLK